MGGGGFNYNKSLSRGVSYSNQSREEVFQSRSMNKEMNIKYKIREARDSDEHPNSFPIILALDVTGSMGIIPEYLIKIGFPQIMKKIMDEGIEHPQVCFLGIGDHYSDEAPLQVGQFESSDELLDKWLKIIWLEGHGGGNGGESYSLAWYFAARHTAIDCMLKRNQKGVLITIGNEPCHGSLSDTAIDEILGDSLEGKRELASSVILKEAQENWDVYHINLNDYMGNNDNTKKSWYNLLGDKVITTEDAKGKDIPNLISGIILSSYTSQVNSTTSKDHTVNSKEDKVKVTHKR